jgi:epoxide hydrolase 4
VPGGASLNDTYVSANGIRFHCLTAGEGPLILFIHGFPEFSYAWKEQLREFGKDHLAVAPDLRGFNLSDKPTGLDAYSIPVLLEDIRTLADHFRSGTKFVLVAHDWGGALAWVFAIVYPHYLEKLVILNGPHPTIFRRLLSSDPDQQSASQYMLLFRSSSAEAQLSANNYALLVNVVLAPLLQTGAFTEADKSAYLSAWSQPGALTGGLNYYRASHLGPPVPSSLETEIGPSDLVCDPNPAHSQVHVPTLVLWGEQDVALTTKNLDGLDQLVTQLTILRFPDASHWLIHEKPAEVSAAIRAFLH